MVRVKNRFLIIFAMIFALLVNYCIPLAQIASAADVNAISAQEEPVEEQVVTTNQIQGKTDNSPYKDQ